MLNLYEEAVIAKRLNDESEVNLYLGHYGEVQYHEANGEIKQGRVYYIWPNSANFPLLNIQFKDSKSMETSVPHKSMVPGAQGGFYTFADFPGARAWYSKGL